MTATTIKEILFELNSKVETPDKKQYFDEHFADIIDELVALNDNDREINIDRILNAFFGSKLKGSIKKIIDAALANRIRQEAKSKIGSFTGANIVEMMDSKGNIAYTTSHVIDILLAAYDIKLVVDLMSEQPHFVKMPWSSLTDPFTLPLMTNGNTHIFYPYDNVNRTALKKVLNDNVFPQEKIWTGLDDVVEIVAHHDKIDMYQEWMISLPQWDSIDRITDPQSNWVVRHLKTAPGLWSAAWARMLPLSQVWRCFEPGCKQRYYFALEGEQNIGKTDFCKALLPDNPHKSDNPYWYVSETIKNIDKDFLQKIAIAAVIEYPDLDMNRFNLNDWKRLTTDTEIVFRLPYGKLVNYHPKRSISIVTTNEHKYMRDPTGETRAIPIKSLLAQNTFIDHKSFKAEYPQILAQIKEQYYLKGVKPYLTEHEMKLQLEEIEIRDAIHEWMEWEQIERMINDNPQYNNEITMKDIVGCITQSAGVSELQITQAIRNRYGQVLRKMGFEPKRKKVNGKTNVVYEK